MKTKKVWGLFLSVLLLINLFTSTALIESIQAQNAPGAVFYLSPQGNDANTGTIDAPFATLERARDAIRSLKKNGQYPNSGVTVYLRGGEYNISSSFRLEEQDSGTENAPIIYTNYNNEDVFLVGGSYLDNKAFTPVVDEGIKNRLPQESRDKVIVLDLKAQGITDYGVLGIGQPPELFFNGQVMTLSRYPNEGFLQIGDIVELGDTPYYWNESYRNSDEWIPPEQRNDPPKPPIFKYDDPRPERWSTDNDVWMYGYWTHDWSPQDIRLKTLDTINKTIMLEKPNAFGIRAGQRYYYYNILDEIDSPGEYYIDREAGLLYLYPPATMEGASVQLSLLEDSMIDMNKVSNITIKGVTLEVSRGNGVSITDGKNNLIIGCTLRRLARRAVSINSGFNHGVVSCDIYDIGAGGIFLTGGDRITLTPAGHYAENNHIHNYSRIQKTYNGAVNLNGVGNRASYNTIHNAPHLAVYFRGNDHIMEYNEVYDVCQETSDVGVFYSFRNWTYRGNVIRYNFVHDIIGIGGFGAVAIYLDDAYSSAEVHGNVFYNIPSRAFVIGGGRDNIVTNNILIDTGGISLGDRAYNMPDWFVKAMDPEIGPLYTRLRAMPYQSEPWRSRYPELASILDSNPGIPAGNVIARNVLVNSPDLYVASIASEHGTIENNWITNEDPGFTNATIMDFSLTENAILFERVPGFENIPFHRIGIYIDDYRKELPASTAEPETFTLIRPVDHAEKQDPTKVELTWEPSMGASKYKLMVSENMDFDDSYSKMVMDTSIVLSDLKYGTTYYWKVESFPFASFKMESINTNFSNVQSFTTSILPGPPEDLKAVVSKELDEVRLTWSPKEGATSYTVYKSSESGANYILLATYVNGTEYVDRKVEKDQVYYYVVTAVNDDYRADYTRRFGASEYSTELMVEIIPTTINNNSSAFDWVFVAALIMLFIALVGFFYYYRHMKLKKTHSKL